jgi:hypothetical protein
LRQKAISSSFIDLPASKDAYQNTSQYFAVLQGSPAFSVFFVISFASAAAFKMPIPGDEPAARP